MQDISSKWGKEVAERGFTQIPNYLIRINMFVHDDHKLSPTETIVLFHLIASWWKKDEMPFPSLSTLAEQIGISQRQVQRSVNTLEEKGYIKRMKKKVKGVIASNVYDLSPLVEILNTVAGHFINKHPRNIKTTKNESELTSEQSKKKRKRTNVGSEENVI